ACREYCRHICSHPSLDRLFQWPAVTFTAVNRYGIEKSDQNSEKGYFKKFRLCKERHLPLCTDCHQRRIKLGHMIAAYQNRTRIRYSFLPDYSHFKPCMIKSFDNCSNDFI